MKSGILDDSSDFFAECSELKCLWNIGFVID